MAFEIGKAGEQIASALRTRRLLCAGATPTALPPPPPVASCGQPWRHELVRLVSRHARGDSINLARLLYLAVTQLIYGEDAN